MADAIGDRSGPLVLVAQSLAGFVAPLVCTQVPVDLVVLVAAMVPLPGETAAEWWAATGQSEAQDALRAAGRLARDRVLPPRRAPRGARHAAPAPPARRRVLRGAVAVVGLARGPDAILACRDHRLFPEPWLRGVVHERLGIEADVVPGGHCAYLSAPGPLAAAIAACWDEQAALGHDGCVTEVHLATDAHADGCVAVLAALPDHFTPDTHDEVRADLRRGTGWVVVEDGEVAASFVAVRGFPASAELTFAAVLPERHRAGIGRVLVDRALDDLAAAGVMLVEVKTLDESAGYEPYVATRAFWEEQGFVQVDRIDPLPGWQPGNPAALYVAALRPTR